MLIMKRVLFSLALALGLALPAFGQSFGDTLSVIGPGNCAPNVSATFVALAAAGAGTGPAAVGTALTPTMQASSSGAATDTISCDLTGMTRATTGKGMNSVAGIAFFYGIVTTTATSESAPACVSLSFPVPSTSETASTAAGTALTVTSIPVVASANLTAVTTGQFYTTYLAFSTPPALPISTLIYSKIICSFAFGQTAASAMVVNTPGAIVFTTNTIAWMKRHGHDASVDAMLHVGMSRETAELTFAHYQPKDRKAQEYVARYEARHDHTLAALGEQVSYGPMIY